MLEVNEIQVMTFIFIFVLIMDPTKKNYSFWNIKFHSTYAGHIEYIVNKTKYLIFILSKLATIMQPKTLLSIY